MTILQCENLCKTYGKNDAAVKAVQDFFYAFQENTFYSIIGKSGSGKSTLLHLLSGFLKPTDGKIIFDQKDINTYTDDELNHYHSSKIGFIYQDFRLLPELTVSENIQLPMVLADKKIEMDQLVELASILGITKQLNKYPFEISGGEQQRCAIARAVFTHPKILFADEPTGNLDKASAQKVLDCLLQVQARYHTTFILVTHDLDLARCADKILHLEDGRLVN